MKELKPRFHDQFKRNISNIRRLMLRTIVSHQVKESRSRNRALNKCWNLCNTLSSWRCLTEMVLPGACRKGKRLCIQVPSSAWTHWEQRPLRLDQGRQSCWEPGAASSVLLHDTIFRKASFEKLQICSN